MNANGLEAVLSTVHPRVGGEHLEGEDANPHVHGSSPRGRGTLTSRASASIGRRFIPAWAGNMRGVVRGRGEKTVHPRVGGEHEIMNEFLSSKSGSSPRGRGTCITTRPLGADSRFIPAWAGNITSVTY